MTTETDKTSIVRRGGMLVIATFLGGVFMAGVQYEALHNSVMTSAECNDFVVLMRLIMLAGAVPSQALEAIFARQSAMAVDEYSRNKLTASIRAVLASSAFVWFAVAGVSFIFRHAVAGAFHIANPASVGIAALMMLAVMWGPTLKGLLQGTQRFGAMGALVMLEGAVRLGLFLLFVNFLKNGSAGGLMAVLAGQYIMVSITLWLTKETWSHKGGGSFSWRQWAGEALPMTAGMGAWVFMSIQPDTVFVKYFWTSADHVRLFNSAMFIGFAVVQFIGPVTTVMFPIIARNTSLSKTSDALLLTLALTAGFGSLCAIVCTVFPELPLRVLAPDQLAAAPLVPWYAWSVVPLIMANVLVNNLMAAGKFRSVIWLVSVPALYAVAMVMVQPWLGGMEDFAAFKWVIVITGIFSILFCGVAAACGGVIPVRDICATARYVAGWLWEWPRFIWICLTPETPRKVRCPQCFYEMTCAENASNEAAGFNGRMKLNIEQHEEPKTCWLHE